MSVVATKNQRGHIFYMIAFLFHFSDDSVVCMRALVHNRLETGKQAPREFLPWTRGADGCSLGEGLSLICEDNN